MDETAEQLYERAESCEKSKPSHAADLYERAGDAFVKYARSAEAGILPFDEVKIADAYRQAMRSYSNAFSLYEDDEKMNAMKEKEKGVLDTYVKAEQEAIKKIADDAHLLESEASEIKNKGETSRAEGLTAKAKTMYEQAGERSRTLASYYARNNNDGKACDEYENGALFYVKAGNDYYAGQFYSNSAFHLAKVIEQTEKAAKAENDKQRIEAYATKLKKQYNALAKLRARAAGFFIKVENWEDVERLFREAADAYEKAGDTTNAEKMKQAAEAAKKREKVSSNILFDEYREELHKENTRLACLYDGVWDKINKGGGIGNVTPELQKELDTLGVEINAATEKWVHANDGFDAKKIVDTVI